MEISYQIYSWLKESGIVKSYHQKGPDVVVLSEAESEKIELGLIHPLISQIVKGGLPDESELQTVNSKVARLNNWNLLIKPLESLNVKISSDMKALIVAGDRQQVLEILTSLYKSVYLLTKRKPQKASFEGGVLLDNLNLSNQLIDSESVLEFFVLSFCKCFKTSAKVSAGLLAQNGSFLAQLLKKGLKRDFTPVLLWLDLITSNSSHLSSLISSEKKSLRLILNSLKSGLNSSSEPVIDKTANSLLTFYKSLNKYEEDCHKWFIDESDSLSLCFKLIDKRIEVLSIVELVVLYTKKDLLVTFGGKLRDYCKKTGKYLEFVQKIIESFKNLNIVTDIFNCGLVKTWIDTCFNNQVEDIRNYDSKANSLTFLCDIWKFFYKNFENHEELSNNILTFIKRVIRDGSRFFKILTFGRLFDIFVTFTEEKNQYAPILYKTLIFGLIENYHDERIREFMYINFTRVLDEDLSIPLSILIEPLIKQALILKHLTHQVFDFDFYISLGRHAKLSLKDAILIADICCKAISSDSIFSKTAEIPFMIISSRFIEQKPYQDYLSKFITLIIKLRINNASKPEDYEISGRNLALIEKIIRFNQYDLNEKLKDLMQNLVHDIKRTRDKKLEVIYKALFDPYRSNYIPDNHLKSDSFVVASLSSVPHTRVLMELERIKQRRLMKEYQEKVQTEHKSLQNIIQKKALKHEINKRRIELGVHSKLNNEDRLIVTPEAYPKDHSLDLVKINEEAPETCKLIKTVVKRYNKATRMLFNKYSGQGYKLKGSVTPTFEKYQKTKEIMKESDFSLFLRDFAFLPNLITVDEMKKLFIDLTKKNHGELEYDEFPDLLYMTSRLISSKNLQSCAKFPEALHLQMLFEHIQSHSEGLLPKFYFTEPDCGYGDRDIARALNDKLEAFPDFSLPYNWKKYEETTLVVKYEAVHLKKSKRIALKVLDDVIFSLFSFHFLMPVLETQVKVRAKGVLRKDDLQGRSLKQLNQIESNPGFGKLPGHLKLHAIQMAFDEDITLECTKLIDDLIYSVEKNSFVLISRYPKPAGKLTNRVVQERQMIELEKHYQSERAEERRKNRAKKLGIEVEKIKLEKEYKEYLDREEIKKARIDARYQEKRKKKEWDKKKFEIDEKILEFKLNKLEKQISQNNSENYLPGIKNDVRSNMSYDHGRFDSRDNRRDGNKPRSVPRVFNRFFKK